MASARKTRLAWGLVAPAVFVVGRLLIAYPTILIFFDVRLDGSKTFVGLRNYSSLLANPAYYSSIATTILFLLGSVSGSTLLGLGTALLMNRDFPMRSLVRTLIILPYFAPVISMVFGWQFIFDPVNGNFVFAETFALIPADTNLIGDPESVLWVLIAFTTWKYFPITYLPRPPPAYRPNPLRSRPHRRRERRPAVLAHHLSRNFICPRNCDPAAHYL